MGIVGGLVPLALLALLIPLRNPRIALGLLVGSAILFEASSPNLLHFTTQQVHDPVPGHYGLLELLMALAVVSVVLDAVRQKRWPVRPAPFGPVLALLVLILITGSLVAHFDGGEGFDTITEDLRPILPMIILPWLTVNALRDREDVRRALQFVAILIVVKAVLGLLGVVTHTGVGTGGSTITGVATAGSTITYYEPSPNFLSMAYVLVVLTALLSRVPLSRLAKWSGLIVLVCLALSLRRSFWIGTAAAIPIAFAIATAPGARRFLVPALVVLAAALFITFSTGVSVDSQSELGQRVSSLQPSKVETNPQDRYRLDERKNVLAEVQAHPVFGIGLGVPWTDRYPLSVENAGARAYVHMAVLFYWLKFGVLGILAYVGYLAAAIAVAIKVFRRHHDSRIRVAAGGFAAALVGLAVAEVTATFLGSDLRTGVVVGFGVGLLSIAYSELSAAAPGLPRIPGPAARSRRTQPTPLAVASAGRR